MKEKIIYSLIIDQSGSMFEIQEEILISINQRIETIKGLKEDDSEILAEITLFNHQVSPIIPLCQSRDLQPLKPKDYQVTGATALFDAIGFSADKLKEKFKNEMQTKTCKIAMVIFTDGYENASNDYNEKDIKKLLKMANESEVFDISIVGSDEDIIIMAQRMNFKSTQIVRTAKKDLGKSMAKMDAYFNAISKRKKANFKHFFTDKNNYENTNR